MANGRFVAYYRVSTQKQGQSGLGLEAQRKAVAEYLNGGRWTLLAEFTEVESGKRADRPQLREALALCRKHKATLVVAKLDRLARNVHFLSGLMEAGVEFVAADMPTVNRLTIHVLAAVAEHEREMVSQRTRAALAAAKARGVRLGVKGRENLAKVNDRKHAYAQAHADRVRKTLLGLKAQGLSHRAMVEELNTLNVPAPRGGRWHLPTVQRVLARLEASQPA
jgi:DNA invertase Pin-like site-specific DNA recombinase